MSSPKQWRSQPTRDRILKAAREIFAREGYESATVRQIAELAQANVSLVIRYYRSKEDLFAAAADFDLRLPSVQGVASEAIGRALAAHFFARWEDEASGQELMALLRASASHAAARERMKTIFSTQVLATIVEVRGAEDASAGQRAALIASQMLGLAIVRYVLELPFEGLQRATLIDVVGTTLQRYLMDPLENNASSIKLND